MRNISKISFPKKNQILCVFDNGEKKVLDLEAVLKDQYGEKVLKKELYNQAKIGTMGEILWENLAEITNLKGIKEPCDYDISPDFAYNNSVSMNNESQ